MTLSPKKKVILMGASLLIATSAYLYVQKQQRRCQKLQSQLAAESQWILQQIRESCSQPNVYACDPSVAEVEARFEEIDEDSLEQAGCTGRLRGQK